MGFKISFIKMEVYSYIKYLACKVADAKVILHVQNPAWATSYCQSCSKLD